jgi:hypothetical protein
MKRPRCGKCPASILSVLLILPILATFTIATPVVGSEKHESSQLDTSESRPDLSSGTTGSEEEITTQFFTVVFDGRVTRVSISPAGAVEEAVKASSPDGRHTLDISSGTIAHGRDGNPINLIQINETQIPQVPDGKVAISKAFDFKPDGVIFSKPVVISLGYDINQLPKNIASVDLAYYSADLKWVELKAKSGSVAEAGKASSLVDHFTTYAVLASKTPAAFKAKNLCISPSSTRTWGIFAFAVRTGTNANVSVDVVNEGGQKGNYLAVLKVNGKEIEKKSVLLEPNLGSKVHFELVGMSQGHYSIEVGGLTGEFRGTLWINWWLIVGVILGTAAVYWLFRRLFFRANSI